MAVAIGMPKAPVFPVPVWAWTLPQQRSLESIRELWTSYVTHYSVIAV